VRAGFIAFACLVGLGLAVIVRDEKGPVPARLTTPATPATHPAPARPRIVISGRDRDAIYGYYGIDHAPGGCPPGLSKESNGCLPAGDARGSWVIGRPLSGDVIVYPLPAVLLGQLSPPNGYQYARVGNDVLVLGIESRVVAGAVAGIGRN
jgi:hypothetical protein